MKIPYSEKIEAAVSYLRPQIPFEPEVGIILGTGLGQLMDEVQVEWEVDYSDIPHFPVSTVESHLGKIIFGHLENRKVLVLKGRVHYYEGYDMKQVTFPVRVLRQLGVKRLFISNAAGGLDPKFSIGDLMIVNDHIDLFPENPLRGPNLSDFGSRFPDMSEPYDPALIRKALDIGERNNIPLHQGVYVGLSGPNLETRAEYRYLRTIGADAVGMSTVPEVIVARHMGLPVFVVSAITDLCTPEAIKKITIEEVIAAAAKAEPGITRIIRGLISSS